MLLIKKLVFCSEKTNLTLTSEEKSDDIEIEEKDALTPNNRKGQVTTNPLTPEDKAIKIPNKKQSIEHSANNAYFIEKIKGQRVRNGQTKFFIKLLGPEKKISLSTIIEFYFRESSDKEISYDAYVCSAIQFSRQHDPIPKVSRRWKIFCKSLLL